MVTPSALFKKLMDVTVGLRLRKVANICHRGKYDGAGDGTRTRDNLLGRQELCQLSYSRSPVKLYYNY